MNRKQLLRELLLERYAPLPTPEPDNSDGPTARAGHLLHDHDQAAGPLADVVPLHPRRAA